MVTGPGTAEPAGDRYTVQSLTRGMAVLEVLAADDASRGLGVTEISERVGLSKSTVFAILHTFRGAGYVADTGAGRERRYLLGMRLARLGAQARSRLSVPDLARAPLERLAHELGHAVRIGVVDGAAIEVVDRIEAPRGISIDLRMGSQELLHSTGIGKAVIATWPDDEVARALGEEPYRGQTSRTRTSLVEVVEDLVEIRRRGYAVDDEEDHDGILCIGAPLRIEGDGRATWGISTTMVKAAVTEEERHRIGTALAATARAIGDLAGGPTLTTAESSDATPPPGRAASPRT